MKVCKKCNGTSIRSRTNYSHGKKSKGRKIFSCKSCGSTDIEIKQNTGKGFPKRREKPQRK